MLKCYVVGRNLISGQPEQYKIADGAVFTDNYNETLDSATIILPHLDHEIEIEPLDIVVVFSTDDSKVKIKQRRMCVDSFSQTQTCLSPAIYKYEIKLCSETKILETILLPSMSITPAKSYFATHHTLYSYMQQVLSQYSPKLYSNETSGAYGDKFTFGHNVYDSTDTVADRFNETCPEMQWNEPTLREILTDLMMAKDCIPVLQNNVINFIDISQSKSEITDAQKTGINYIRKSMSTDDYVSEIKMNVSNGLNGHDGGGSDGDNYISSICEEIGFRNNEAYLLTTENVMIDTSFPIWTLRDVWISFEVSGVVNYEDEHGNSHSATVSGTYESNLLTYYILEYGEWRTKNIKYAGFGSTEPLSTDYQNTCLYYKRGSRGIYNFQGKQERQALWIKDQTSVLELIFHNTSVRSFLMELAAADHPEGSGFYVDSIDTVDWASCRFKVNYIPLIDCTFFASKKNMPRNKRQVIDNQTNSYINMEKLGALEYLKANRLGNLISEVNGRYKTDEVNIPDLSYKINGDIIFKKEIAVYNQHIKVNYLTTKNYVLKDYFTSIKSKLRSWKIVDGNEAFIRSDVLKFYINENIPSIDNATYKLPSYSTLDEYLRRFKYCCIRFFDKNNNVIPNGSYVGCDGYYDGVNAYMVEVAKTKCGNSVLLTLRMEDNTFVNRFVYNTNFGDHGGVQQKNAVYTDEYGENAGGVIFFYENFNPILGTASAKVSSGILPGVNLSKQMSNIVARIPFSFKKDNKEITQITIQFEMNEEANDMFLGKK